MRTVFLIDDDPVFLFLVEKMLHNIDASLAIQSFPDGELAMGRLNGTKGNVEQLPDIILLDLNMPVMDGWEFLEYYTDIYPTIGKEIALYIVSSTISPTEIAKASQYPLVSDILIKPLEKDRLAKVLFNTGEQ